MVLNDGLQTVAFVSIENSQFFGMNRQAIPGLLYHSENMKYAVLSMNLQHLCVLVTLI
ncbi:hypothetical protein NA898_15935 [Proteus cibi]|uniref:Uncharacterized protein n=1 Tax=Proteus cibi TaxID=2050966 RepID=A0ABU6EIL2_9GAMM|nr:hypothetical protein [Proteus cibi]EST59260.1 hypothetical protein K151_731 [Proteus hauseri ZMd44]MEB6858555.1 hypothetical protein [Proteus cibi]MEB7090022.1 hypothetical protein [Proteus cibi]